MSTYTLTGRMGDDWSITETGLTEGQVAKLVTNCIGMCSSMEITKEP